MNIWKTEHATYDLLVCGGGLAGVSAAIAAARRGLSVGLVHDRTVLGGNSSSEVRVTPHGAAQYHAYARETGIISELLIEERARNHETIFENGWTNSVWDLVLLEAILAEPSITLHLNTKAIDVKVEGKAITSVESLVLDSETRLVANAQYIVDATGDGLIAAAAGCKTMFGTEGKDVWNEPHAEGETNNDTMGNSLHFKTADAGRETSFEPPAFAKDLTDPHFFYGSGRHPIDERGGFWWIELGTPFHTIYDNRAIRHELTGYVLGIWNWMKNHDPDMMPRTRTRALDWIGSVLGTRESRRIVGNVIVNEHHLQSQRIWDDEVAFGGWFLDLHTPGGLIAEHSEANAATNYSPFTERAALGYVGPYGIPLSALVARDLDNLFLAGRNVSVSHAALGSVRVMGTTALMGQAVGTAAAQCVSSGRTPSDLAPTDINAIQQQLLRDGAWLPNVSNSDTDDLARVAHVTASSEDVCRGLAPDDLGYAETNGMIADRTRPGLIERAETRFAQLIATDGSIEELALPMSVYSDGPTTIELALVPCNGIFDYQVYGPDARIASVELTLEPGDMRWVSWRLDVADRERLKATVKEAHSAHVYVRLELARNPDVHWHYAHMCLPAQPGLYEMALNKFRRLQDGASYGFRVLPAQRVFDVGQVVSGETRPHRTTNLWRSEANAPLPASITFEWDEVHSVTEVDITFAGNILHEYHAYQPFFRAPEAASDYTIDVCDTDAEGPWKTVLEVSGNYRRHCVHQLDLAYRARKLRITFRKTNGDAAVGVYEVRIYQGSGEP